VSVEHKWTVAKSTTHPNELEVTITIRGAYDIYRFAHHMLEGQVEFSRRGWKIIEQLKRRMKLGQWSYLDRTLGGWRMRGAKEPKGPTDD
jgi:hypothetical protein